VLSYLIYTAGLPERGFFALGVIKNMKDVALEGILLYTE
jgi:hypothetical protein